MYLWCYISICLYLPIHLFIQKSTDVSEVFYKPAQLSDGLYYLNQVPQLILDGDLKSFSM